jgi:predicted outer membrane lipoprotein
MTPSGAATVVLVAALVGASMVCVRRALAPPPPRRRDDSASTPGALAGLGRDRIAIGIAVGFVTLLASRWVLLAVALGVLAAMWGRVMRDDRADRERRRLEAIAAWLEDLRDTLRGSSVGVEEALEQVAARPPDELREAMAVFQLRRRQGFRTEDALDDLADRLAHPTSDAAVAALRLVVTGAAASGRLWGTVDALAAAARDEVRARERIDRTRAVYQGSMQRLVVIAVVLVAYLRLAAGSLLDPYGTPAGQVVLVVPLAMWAGCVAWLRRLCRYEMPDRARAAVISGGGG